MARHSSIRDLPEEVRDGIAQRLAEFHTINQVLEYLEDEHGITTISKSAMGRHAQKYRATIEKLNQSKEFARQLAMDLGEREGDKTFELIVEMLSSAMFHFLQARTTEDADQAFKPSDFTNISIALKTMAEAKIKDINHTREVRAEAQREAAEEAGKVMKERGLTAETVQVVKDSIMGLKRPGKGG